MLVYQLGLLLLLLAVCSFAPGFFFVRKLPWNPLEKLCGSVGLSLILLYLAAWAVYIVGARGPDMPVHPAPYVAISLVCVALGAAAWKDAARLLRSTAVRRALAGYGFLLVWTGLLMAVIRNYSGGVWFGDWLEHFQRSLFFLRHFPAKTWIYPGYVLPARPPMMNVLSAFFLAQTDDRFELFQTIFVFLNLLLFLPCNLVMPALGKRARRRTWLLVLLFAASPLVMQNITYTWTKAGAAFYVVLALWFYLAGWRKQDTVRTVAAFVALAAGLVVHYSAGPYVVIFTLHYLTRLWPRRPNRWRELGAIAGICGALVGVWLVWSIAVYGSGATFASNTTVTSSQQYSSNAAKIFGNLFDSIVPLMVRDPLAVGAFRGQRVSANVRDTAFVFYQLNAIFAMGLVGGPLAIWLAYRSLRPKPKPAPGKKARARPKRKDQKYVLAAPKLENFWRWLIGAGLVLGIAVVGERDNQGVAHLTLLALQTVGLAMLAAMIPWRRRTLAIALLAGCAVDFSFGVLLHAHVEGLENTATDKMFPDMVFTGKTIQTADPNRGTLSNSAWSNWFEKRKLALYDRWYRELNQEHGTDPAFQKLLPGFQKTIADAQSDDKNVWYGWFGRHGGQVEFLGDYVAPPERLACEMALVALFLGLAGAVYVRGR